MAPATETDFRSDNVASVSPQVLDALFATNRGTASSYGDDSVSAALTRQFAEVFETRVAVFPVATGTAANALSLATCARPYGGILCYEQAHILTSEGAATEAFSGGAKLIPVPGKDFRLQAKPLEDAVAAAADRQRHHPQLNAISVTQATERGTVYRTDELATIGNIAHHHSLHFHMDGARLANALASQGVSAAAMTWRCGVDILSFGATKNGGLNADAIVVFESALTEGLSYRLRRAGHTWSKMRFAAAGLLAYVQDELYLRSAARANTLAQRLNTGLQQIPAVRVVSPVETNIVFVEMAESLMASLRAEGFLFFVRGPRLIRLVCRFDSTEDEVDRLLSAVRQLSLAAPTTRGSALPLSTSVDPPVLTTTNEEVLTPQQVHR
jgi:threonine aldolase